MSLKSRIRRLERQMPAGAARIPFSITMGGRLYVGGVEMTREEYEARWGAEIEAARAAGTLPPILGVNFDGRRRGG